MMKKLFRIVDRLEDGDVEEITIDEKEFNTLLKYIIKNGKFEGFTNSKYEESSVENAEFAYYEIEGKQIILRFGNVEFIDGRIIKSVDVIHIFNKTGGELDVFYE